MFKIKRQLSYCRVEMFSDMRDLLDSGRCSERTRPCKNPVGNSIAVVKATAPLSHSKFRPQIERFLECESGAVAFTPSYLQVEKDF